MKGCGVASGKVPELKYNETGVLFMHEAIVELINQVLLTKLFHRDGVELSTLPFYAIANTGIHGKVPWANREMPCAALLRKTLVRLPNHIELPAMGSDEEAIQHDIECYLLSRGLTSTGPITTVTVIRKGNRYVTRLDGALVPPVTDEIICSHLRSMGLQPPQMFLFANVQIARAATLEPLLACLIDLGHIRACGELQGHLGVFVHDMPLSWGRTTLKSFSKWPIRSELQAVDLDVLGPQVVRERWDDETRSWLQPTDSFRHIASGVMCEAIRLTMLLDSGRCSPDQLIRSVTEFVDSALPLE